MAHFANRHPDDKSSMKKYIFFIFIIISFGQETVFGQKKFHKTVIELITSDFPFYIPVKVTDDKKQVDIMLPWTQLQCALHAVDSSLRRADFEKKIEKSLQNKFVFVLDTSSFRLLTSEFHVQLHLCNDKESLREIIEKYFDKQGFIKNSIDNITRACIINRLFTNQILVFQDDFSGYYRLEKDALKKAK